MSFQSIHHRKYQVIYKHLINLNKMSNKLDLATYEVEKSNPQELKNAGGWKWLFVGLIIGLIILGELNNRNSRADFWEGFKAARRVNYVK